MSLDWPLIFDDFDRFRIAGVHGHEDGVHGVAGHVGEGAAAEVEEPTPVEGMIDAAAFVGRIVRERPRRGRTEPEVPVEFRRNGIGGGGRSPPCGQMGRLVTQWISVMSPRHAAIHEFIDTAVALVGVAVVAHLGGHFEFLGGQLELPGFPDGVGQGFLGENMFAGHHGEGGGGEVVVVRRADHHGIDVLRLLRRTSSGSPG